MFLTRKYYSNQAEIVRIYCGLLRVGIKEVVTSRQMHFIILFTFTTKKYVYFQLVKPLLY